MISKSNLNLIDASINEDSALPNEEFSMTPEEKVEMYKKLLEKAFLLFEKEKDHMIAELELLKKLKCK